MHCPYCPHTDTRVLDSRVAEDGTSIRRRRACPECGRRFTTVEQMQLTVVKRSGATEPFSREKVITGVRKACKGRPVSDDDLARLGSRVEDDLRGSGWAEVPAPEVGLAILGPLRELDEVAYLRFASVYRAFESADDFETEIALLRAEHSAAGDDSEHSGNDRTDSDHADSDHTDGAHTHEADHADADHADHTDRADHSDAGERIPPSRYEERRNPPAYRRTTARAD